MSMIRAQVDELRSMAASVGLAMPQAATLMMGAADAIWELRESVHRERAEADRLRQERCEYQATIDSLVDECTDHKAENDRLRELIEQMHRYMADTVEYNGYTIQTTGFTMLGSRVKECEEAMSELGIEVS